ncbi:MAG: hypothetical protein HZA51_17215 [Planctomycetes bacterium]|nr:hypothetical protein [Planctomycetota bacterium]
MTSHDLPIPSLPKAPDRARSSRWYVRIPVKTAVFFLVVLFVCFPYPRQLARNIEHLRNMESMIEPHAPELARYDAELKNRIEKIATTQPNGATRMPQAVQREVERFVFEKVQYEWDWNLWGSADYMPTVGEMFDKAKENGGQVKEDCDGRAVMAASLMRRLGYRATMVTDLRHVWVTTPEGEWMGPGGAKAMVATSQGTQVNWGTSVRNAMTGLSYGIAVFPFVREMIILLTLFVLMLRGWSQPRWAAAGLLLMIQGLLFMRLGFLAPQAVSREVSEWPTWVGLVHVASAIFVLNVADRRGRAGLSLPAIESTASIR